MSVQTEDKDKQAELSGDPEVFLVAIWETDHHAPAQILGRAVTISLARAIFLAALNEYRGRRITISQGGQILEQSPG